MNTAVCVNCGFEKSGPLSTCPECGLVPRAGLPAESPPASSGGRRRELNSSALHESPFAVLAASPRDSRKRIVELAEEKALEVDHARCQKARTDLTNPRTRLSAEVAWLPGVSPRRAYAVTQALLTDPMAARVETGLPALAHCNLMAAAFDAVDSRDAPEDVADFIHQMARRVEELAAAEILQAVNEDRAISGFPEVRGTEQVEVEIAERKRYYRHAIKAALNRLTPTAMVEALTITVDRATDSGKTHAPELVDETVDSYAVETKSVLDRETANVANLLGAIRQSAPAGAETVKPIIDRLDAAVRSWDKVAQPLQLSYKTRGLDHEPSRAIAYEIRNLAVELFNEHDLLEQSQRLTALLKELFSEVLEVAERVDEDTKALSDIAQQRSESVLIDPIRQLCESISKSADKNPSRANDEGLRLLREGLKLLNATPIRPNTPIHNEAGDLMAMTLLYCAIAYARATSNLAPCVTLLTKAIELASDGDLRQKLHENLAAVQSGLKATADLEPISSAPSLSTINGVGFRLYGSTDEDPSNGSHMATYYFVVLFVPLFPLARYRVVPTEGGYQFLGKGKLRSFDKWHIAISAGLLALLIANS